MTRPAVAPPDGAPHPVREFTDLSVFRIPPGAGLLDEKVLVGIAEDFGRRIERGEPHQLVPGIAAPNAESPELFDLGDGRHRFEACRRMGLPFRAELRREPFAPGELNRIRASSLLKRKRPDHFELADIVTAQKREMGFTTWAQAAENLGVPASTMSSITCVRRIPPDLRPKTEGLGPRAVRAIARIEGREGMEKALDFAFQDGEPTPVETLELFIKREIKGERRRGRKPGAFRGRFEGRQFSVELKEKDAPHVLAEWLKGLGARVARGGQELPLEGLSFLFR